MKFAIYPPINIARLGNSPTGFFIGAETQGSPGTEISDIGEESPVSAFKDKNFRVKRQAARFRIYEFNDDGSGGRPAILPSGTKVRWSVRLVNKKDAVVRSSGPPTHPTVPAQDPSRTDRVIDSGLREALPSQEVSLQGTYRGTPVYLGEVRLDPNGNLLVLGGRGVSNSLSTPTLPAGAPIGNEVGGGGFYNNRDWHDDTSDGPVTASIEFPDGSSQNAAGAWVIVGPPDFARASQAIVTLYDVIFQTAYSQHWVTPASTPSFARDIQPLIARASSLRWAHADPTWGQISTDWSTLSLPDATTAALRKKTRDAILHAQNAFSQFRIQIWQKEYLDKWVSGGFANDWPAGTPPAGDISPASITRVALDGTAGQGFFPGIEGGIILSDASLYLQPFKFRLDPAKVSPGDVTALMALPWQADFLECNTGWWPSQRPDLAPQADGTLVAWARPLDEQNDHRKLVAIAMQLGVVTPKIVSGQQVAVEELRDPSL